MFFIIPCMFCLLGTIYGCSCQRAKHSLTHHIASRTWAAQLSTKYCRCGKSFFFQNGLEFLYFDDLIFKYKHKKNGHRQQTVDSKSKFLSYCIINTAICDMEPVDKSSDYFWKCQLFVTLVSISTHFVANHGTVGHKIRIFQFQPLASKKSNLGAIELVLIGSQTAQHVTMRIPKQPLAPQRQTFSSTSQPGDHFIPCTAVRKRQ